MQPKKFLPLLAITVITTIFFHKFFLSGLLPVPADIITGVYYPWLDYKWGNTVGVAVKNPLMSDIPSLIYPWRTLAIDLMKNWQWPLWNQYSFSGYPLLGNWQSAPFSPANLFYLIEAIPPLNKGGLGGVTAWSLGIIFQPLFASYFMYLWLRNKKLNKLPSLLGGILYAYSGFHITWMYYNTHNWTTLWLPLILLSIDKILANKNIKTKIQFPFIWYLKFDIWNLMLAATIAASILSGYPIILIYEAFIIVIYLLFIRHSLFTIHYSLLLISLILGLGISAIQWLPGLQTIQQSIHNIDTSTLQSANQGYLPIQNLITALIPDFFGNPATYNYWGMGFYDNWAFYISIGGLMLACIAFLTKQQNSLFPITYYLLLITFLGLILAIDNPFGNFLISLIPLLKNSIHSRALFLFDFGIAIAAAYGLQALISTKPQKLIKPILITLSIFTFLFMLIWTNLLTKNFLNILNLNDHYQIATRNLILPTAIFLTVSGLLITPSIITKIKFLKSKQKFIFLILNSIFFILIVFDLFRYSWKYLPFTPSQYLYPPTEITDWLIHQKNQSPEPFRVEFGEVIPENMWIPYRLESPAGYDALMPLRYGQFLQAIQSGKLENHVSRFTKIENLDSKLFELTNTKYILAVKYDDIMERTPEGTKLKDIYNKNYLKPVYEHGTVIILENQKYLPRAYVVPKAEIIKDSNQLISTLTDPSTDFLQTVYFDTSAHSPPYEGGVRGGHLLSNYKTSWTQTTASFRVLTVTTDQPGYLVLLESYNPDWQATISNESGIQKTANSDKAYTTLKTKPLRANYTFMAFPIGQGINQIILTYSPDSFKYGLWITGISLLIWIFLTTKVKFINNKQ